MRTTGSWLQPARSASQGRFHDGQDAKATATYYPTEIADLKNQEIRQMSHEELVGVVSAARPLFLNERCPNRLSHFDQATLERLAYLARFCCQNRRARTQFSGNE